MVELAVLLDEIGITPSIQFDQVTRVTISDRLGLARFAELGLATDENDNEKLQKILKREVYRPRLHSDLYEAVWDYMWQNPNASDKEIHEATGVEINTFRSWIREDSVPPMVERRENLERLKEAFEINEIRASRPTFPDIFKL